MGGGHLMRASTSRSSSAASEQTGRFGFFTEEAADPSTRPAINPLRQRMIEALA
jgi:hypothetical protein